MTIRVDGRYTTLDAYFAPSRDGYSSIEVVGHSFGTPGQHTVAQSNVRVASSVVLTTIYRWSDGDRIDTLAYRLLGDSRLYWRIMDLNPQILDPTGIQPGTSIVVPRV